MEALEKAVTSTNDETNETRCHKLSMPNCFKRYSQELRLRRIKLTGWLLVLYAVGVGMSIALTYNIVFGFITYPEQSSCYAPTPSIIKSVLFVIPAIQTIVLSFAFPFVGWASDTITGRGRSITLSLWLCWLGTLIQMISFCIQYGACGIYVNIAKYGISTVAEIFLIFGTTIYFSNSLAYGLDQLHGRSTAQIRAFLHWIAWGLFVGFSTNFISFVPSVIYNPVLLMSVGLMMFIYLTLVIVIHTFFHYKFRPSTLNKMSPYTLIYNVLKYAKQHKAAVNRSAFTYWEEKTPTRIDLGKRKYGGPFVESDVEDVKTCWRVVVILLAQFGFYVPFFTVMAGILQYINQFEGSTSAIHGYGSFIVWSSCDKMILLLVPLTELVIIPLFPKLEYFLLSPLKGIGVSYIFLLISLMSMVALDIIAISRSTANNTECPLTFGNTVPQYDTPFWYFYIPLFFYGIASYLSFVFSFDLVISQAPANMSGMLTGVYWLMRAVYIYGGALVTMPFNLYDTGSRCTLWTLIVQITICVIGGIVYVIAVKRYQSRKREEDFFAMKIIAEKFEKQIREETDDQNELTANYNDWNIYTIIN